MQWTFEFTRLYSLNSKYIIGIALLMIYDAYGFSAIHRQLRFLYLGNLKNLNRWIHICIFMNECLTVMQQVTLSAERHGLGTDTFGLLIGSYLESIYLQIYCWPIANGETPNDMGKWIAWIIKWKFTIQRRNNSKRMYIGDWIYHCLGNIATSHYTGSIYIKCQSHIAHIFHQM